MVEFEAVFFEPLEWRSRLKEGCVVYEPEHPNAVFALLPTKDLWVGNEPPDPSLFEYQPMEVVTVCGDTVHFYAAP